MNSSFLKRCKCGLLLQVGLGQVVVCPECGTEVQNQLKTSKLDVTRKDNPLNGVLPGFRHL